MPDTKSRPLTLIRTPFSRIAEPTLHLIFSEVLNPISSFSYFPELQFRKGDHIRCDQFSNVWVTTRHSGVRTILSESNYQEYWPSYTGMTSDNSGLLSDIVYDIDFDTETGEVYFATDQGISILNSPGGR